VFHHQREENFTARDIAHWYMLAFLAGCVNAGGWMACRRFVSHVTGFATLFGVALAEGRVDGAVGMITVPAYFLLGVIISACLVEKRIHEGKRPHYAAVMLLVTACLLLVAVGGYFGYFSPFDGELKLKRDYFLLALLCMASGLQNAAITTATGARVRTTHLTGVTTDLGLALVRQFNSKLAADVRRRERRENLLRIGKIISFACGGAVSGLIFIRVEFLGFLLPAALAAYASTVAVRERREMGEPRAVEPDPLLNN
jgi:uncharacterized membrane protein YoaK (UPF0700 family)